MLVEVGSFSTILYWLSNLNEGDSGTRFGYFVYMCFLLYWVYSGSLICFLVLTLSLFPST